MENRRLGRRGNFWPAVSDSMDRIGAGEKERDSIWILGMQRAWLNIGPDLFRSLPPRFGGRDPKFLAAADLFAKSLFPLHSSSTEARWSQAADGRVVARAHATRLGTRKLMRLVFCSNQHAMRFVPILLLIAVAVFTGIGAPTPLTVQEIGLMLRTGYSNESVLRELSTRGVADVLDAEKENQLVRAGANAETIEALRSGRFQLANSPGKSPKTNSPDEPKTSQAADRRAPESATRSQPSNFIPEPDAIFSTLKDDLIYLHQGAIVPFDDAVLEKKKYYLLFFSANWTAVGRKFTPELVAWYNRVAPEHPEFEIIFFSADRSQYGMETYLTQSAMPWPAVAFQKLSGKAGDIQRGLVKEIPELVFTDAAGKILSYSHGGDNAVSLEQVLAEASQTLDSGQPAR